ncbi:hypothetical protein ACTWQB_14470 [Piscibacillus sp. B03]|uniref:hypothetical protein n=1 Tax=Piscibacillus sp. B03 TaxID=3457430 RepID=UPI003FCD72A8
MALCNGNIHSSVVGTAFDYIARFLIAKKVNKIDDVQKRIVAINGLKILEKFTNKKTFISINKKYKKSVKTIDKYLNSKNQPFSKLIPSTTFLARLEHIYRSGMPPRDINSSLLEEEPQEIIDDLYVLTETFIERFLKQQVDSNSDVIFNPHFGIGSQICGGADSDVFIDGVLYDFKSSKHLGYKWQDVAQLFGYYILYRVSLNQKDLSSMLIGKDIKKLAFYKARYGEVEYIDMDAYNENELKLITQKIENLFETQLLLMNSRNEFLKLNNEVKLEKKDNRWLTKFLIFLFLPILITVMWVY